MEQITFSAEFRERYNTFVETEDLSMYCFDEDAEQYYNEIFDK